MSGICSLPTTWAPIRDRSLCTAWLTSGSYRCISYVRAFLHWQLKKSDRKLSSHRTGAVLHTSRCRLRVWLRLECRPSSPPGPGARDSPGPPRCCGSLPARTTSAPLLCPAALLFPRDKAFRDCSWPWHHPGLKPARTNSSRARNSLEPRHRRHRGAQDRSARADTPMLRLARTIAWLRTSSFPCRGRSRALRRDGAWRLGR
jgi:hypothetical protein